MGPDSAASRLRQYLDQLLASSGLSLSYTLELQTARASEDASGAPAAPAPPAAPATLALPAAPAAFAPMDVEFSGSDVPLLTARNGELLHAIESIAAAILRLEPADLHLLRFDAGGLRAVRLRWIEASAADAIARVRRTARPYVFPPMNARERRLLHLAIAGSGLESASTGEGPRRSVVFYPAGHTPGAASPQPPRPGYVQHRAGAGNPSQLPGTFRSNSADRRKGSALDPASAIEPGNRAEGSTNAAAEADRIRAIRERFRAR